MRELQMKRKILTIIAAASIFAMIYGTSVFAAPQRMADGQIFDPEFYAQIYPDVSAALGTDTAALYQHYVNYGKAEGRLPYSSASEQAAIPLVCNDFDSATNVLRTFAYINFQSPVAWGNPTIGENVLRWFFADGFIKVAWDAPTEYDPSQITNTFLEEVATSAFAQDSISIASMQYITLPLSNYSALMVAGTGTEYDSYGTVNYVLINTPSGIYLMVYFMNSANGISRLNDFYQMLNSILPITAPTTTTTSPTISAVANNTAGAIASSTSSGYRHSYSEYQAQKERDYAQYQREKQQSYRNNRNKSYSERRADYERVYKRNQTRRKNTYNKYH